MFRHIKKYLFVLLFFALLSSIYSCKDIKTSISDPCICSNSSSQVVYYTVEFNTNGGNLISSLEVEAGAKVDKPTDPTKEGFTFDAWYLGSNLFDFDTNINSNITLEARWIGVTMSLEEFMNFADLTNFTITNINHNTSTINGETNTSQTEHKVSDFNDVTTVYTDYGNEKHYFYFTNNNIYYRLDNFDITSSEWYFVSNEGVYDDVFYFATFDNYDINKFTKREGSNIYDYQVDQEFIDSFWTEIDNVEVYIDLDLMKQVMTYDIVGANVHTVYEFIISDIGTTEVNFSYEISIQSAITRLHALYDAADEYQATSESIQQYKDLINIFLDELDNCDNLNQFFDIYNLRSGPIENFQFTYN